MRVGSQRPRLHSLPGKRHHSCGQEAIEYGESLGYVLDDWQRWCIDGILSEDVNARLCASICLLIVPRQNGKNVVLEIVELYLFYVLEVDVIVHSAHRADTSADHMNRLITVIRNTPELDEITTIYEANGKEKLKRRDTGAELRFVTRSKKIGRGKSPKVVVFDEALYLVPDQMQAIVPSLSAQSMNDDAPLMIYTSSTPLAESQTLHTVRKVAQKGGERTWYAEWGCEEGTSSDDVDALYSANPGLGKRISLEWVLDIEKPLLSEEAFLAERFGVPIGGLDADDVEMPDWVFRCDVDSVMVGDPFISVDVESKGGHTSIVAAGLREDGRMHVEMVAYLEGTSTAAAKVRANTNKVWVEPRSETAGLIQEMTKLGVKVHELSTLDYLQACIQWRRAVENDQIRHRDELPLNVAVANAAVKASGEGWVWARRSSTADISALVAGSVAAWAAGEPTEEEEGDVNIW